MNLYLKTYMSKPKDVIKTLFMIIKSLLLTKVLFI